MKSAPIFQNHFEVLDANMNNALKYIVKAHEARPPHDVNITVPLTQSVCDVIRLANEKDLNSLRQQIAESLKNQLSTYKNDPEKLKNIMTVDSMITYTGLWTASSMYTYER